MLSKVKHKLLWHSLNVIEKRYCSKFSAGDLFGKLTVIGVPFGKGQKEIGKKETGLKCAPDALRNTGFMKEIEELGLKVQDHGNIQYEPESNLQHNNMHNLGHVVPCIKEVSKTVENILSNGSTCLVLGGDHSIAAGSIHGHLNSAGSNEVAVIYVDAHADMNTDRTSLSGNIHGMTLALLLQELKDAWTHDIPGLPWLTPCLSYKDIAFIGLRSVDSEEAKFLHKNKATAFTMSEIQIHGINKVINWALRKIDPDRNKSIHVSFDIDSLDPMEAPCTTVPVRGGLTLREGIEIVETAFDTGRLSVFDLVEVNPSLGCELQQQTTLDAAKQILISSFGYCRRGNYK